MSKIRDYIVRSESIANQTNYVLTGITTLILAAANTAIQTGVVLEDLMRWLAFLWVMAFGARVLERWLTWYTRVKETVVVSEIAGASKTSLTVPVPS